MMERSTQNMMGWKLVFFVFLGTLLLGNGAGEVWSEQATVPEEFLAKPAPKPTKPKPAKPRRQSSEDSDSGSGSGTVSRSSSGRFTKDGHGIIKDKQTSLQWYVGPNSDTNWNQAQSWAQSLSVGGGGWRLPTRGELFGLNGSGDVKALSRDYNVKIDPIFQLGASFVWSGEIRDSSSAWYFAFNAGKEYWLTREGSNTRRAFAVRSR